MKYAILIARLLLGTIFVVFSLNFWLGFIPMPPPPPADSVPGMFMGAVFTTGYMAAVKVCELLGGLFVWSGKFTGLGLLFLGPIILNILFFHLFIDHTFEPISPLAAILALFLLWTKRERFTAFATA